MINVSTEFKERMKERTDFRCYGAVTFADGTTLTLDAKDFAMGGNRVTDGAGAAGLPLGAAICRTVELRLANPEGRLDGYDFYGAKLRLYLTFPLSETEERVELGTFTVTEPEVRGETVTVTAADDMYRTDRAYTTALSYPATLGEMFREVCDGCGVTYSTAEFFNSGFAVREPPGEEYTCRQVLGYIALLAGGSARVHRDGRMEILSYAPGKAPEHELGDWITLTPDTDDVTVTGLEAVDSEGKKVLEGTEGYVLTVEDPLMTGQEAAALSALSARLIGLRVRRFQGEYIGYPLAECMDTARITDRKGRTFETVLTDVTFAFGGRTDMSNSAAAAVRNASRYATPETRARQAAAELTAAERTAREAAVAALNERLSKASGMYGTRQVQPDGSSVWYLHDKPELGQSQAVMKLTSDAIGFSTDGGDTYPFGFTVTGEMVMGIIRSEGITADWVKVGGQGLGAVLEGFVGRDENDQVVSMLNASADQINIRGNRFTLDSDNFKVAADGTATMRNAKITSGGTGSSITIDGGSMATHGAGWAANYNGFGVEFIEEEYPDYVNTRYGGSYCWFRRPMSQGGGEIEDGTQIDCRAINTPRVIAESFIENGTALSKKYLPLAGGTMTGNLTVGNGTVNAVALQYVANNGGRVVITPPAGHGVKTWNIDGYNGILRFFAFDDSGAVITPATFSKALATINAPLEVGAKVQIRTDAEGGNIRLTSPDGTTYAEMDAINNRFRIYLHDNNENKNYMVLQLDKDTANTYIHGASDRVGHALSFTGGSTVKFDGSSSQSVKIPSKMADLSDGDWRAGQTFTIYTSCFSGYISTGSTVVSINVPVGKPITAAGATVTAISGNIRGVKGYLAQGVDFKSAGYTVEAVTKAQAGFIQVNITKSTAFDNATNNTPVSFGGTITFAFTAASDTPLPGPEMFLEEFDPTQDRIDELKAQLAATDYAVVKIAEGAATAEEYADVIAQRQAWRAEINQLEAAV